MESEPTPAAPGPSPNILTRFLRLFTAPRAAFAAPRPRQFWLVPLLLIIAVNVVSSLTLGPIAMEEMRDRIYEMDNLSDAQRDQIPESMEPADNHGIKALQTAGGAAAAIVLAIVIPAVLYLLGINFGVGGRATFRDVFGVQAFSSLVVLLRELITLPLKLSQQTLSVHTSPAAFFDRSAGAIYHIAGLFDVFTLFQLFVTAIGLSVVGNVTARKAGAVVVAFWLLWSVLVVLWRLSPFGAFTP
jgi:hypothetical protein